MKTEEEIVQLFISYAQAWQYYFQERAHWESIEPAGCSWYHWMPLHNKGYGHCHRSWQTSYDTTKYGADLCLAKCSALGEVLGLESLCPGWTPQEGLKELQSRSIDIG